MSILARNKVLVLNKSWHPVSIITLSHAITLVCGEYKNGEPKARILDPRFDFKLFTWQDWAALVPEKDHQVIRSPSRAIIAPEIILLSRYNKLPLQRTHFSRKSLYKRDGNQCQYCGAKPGIGELSIDHILPRSKGGLTTWENCCLACVECNKRKANLTLEQANMKLIRQPFRPRFNFFKGEYRCDSWQSILGECYWNTELENDMKE